MLTETHVYKHLPSNVSTVHLALFSNVSNAAALKNRLVAAINMPGEEGEREREAVNFAFIDAKLITSRLHILTAIYQAILAKVEGSIRTKTVHSEVLWALNHGHNISEAIKRFGLSDTSTFLIVVHICSPSVSVDEFKERSCSVVDGDIVSISELVNCTDWNSIFKYYKLNNDPISSKLIRNFSKSGSFSEEERAIVDQLVVSSVAMKSVSI